METVASRPRGQTLGRQQRAAERSLAAHRSLGFCQLCAHLCGVNRLAGEKGPCSAGPEARIFSAQVEVSDELELIPTYALAFSGCDLRCAFCITGAQSWNPRAGQLFDAPKLAQAAIGALQQGARSIMILGGEPSIHLPAALELVSLLPEEARLIWKTNAHGSAQSREYLSGLFDVWLADYKFGSDACALKLARIDNYTQTVRENLLWAAKDSELIIRHLLMPGHLECCWQPVAAWIHDHLPSAKVNLRAGFWPAWQARRHPELRELVAGGEVAQAWAIAREYQLHLIE